MTVADCTAGDWITIGASAKLYLVANGSEGYQPIPPSGSEGFRPIVDVQGVITFANPGDSCAPAAVSFVVGPQTLGGQ